MTSKNDTNKVEEVSEEIEADQSVSIDDFIRELEEKEKDLHISSEMVIEVEDSEIDEAHLNDLPAHSALVEESVAPGAAPSAPAAEAVASEPAASPADPEPAAPAAGDVAKLETEITKLKTKVSKMEAERSEFLENSVRRQKDFENFRKRTEREREETYQNQLSNLASQMLPVLDNLNRALDSVPDFEQGEDKEFQQFFDGIILVNQQLNEVLAEMGVEPIKAVSEPFDPNYHEAVATEENENFPTHTITQELLRGYKIGEKVIRPAMVKVATSPSAQPTNASENSSDPAQTAEE